MHSYVLLPTGVQNTKGAQLQKVSMAFISAVRWWDNQCNRYCIVAHVYTIISPHLLLKCVHEGLPQTYSLL